MNKLEELAFQHLISELKQENEMLKGKIKNLTQLLAKQNSQYNVRKP